MSRELLKKILASNCLFADLREEVEAELAKPDKFEPDWANYRQGIEDAMANQEPLSCKQLKDAWEEGWDDCRDSEYVGQEAESEAWHKSETYSDCLDIEQRGSVLPRRQDIEQIIAERDALKARIDGGIRVEVVKFNNKYFFVADKSRTKNNATLILDEGVDI